MKYFAKLGLNSKVRGLTHVRDIDAPTEKAGIDYLTKLHNYPFWVQGSKDGSIRKNASMIGATYDEERDAFILKQPFPSWSLNETNCVWEPPVPVPDDCAANNAGVGKYYKWNEGTTSWEEIT